MMTLENKKTNILQVIKKASSLQFSGRALFLNYIKISRKISAAVCDVLGVMTSKYNTTQEVP